MNISPERVQEFRERAERRELLGYETATGLNKLGAEFAVSGLRSILLVNSGALFLLPAFLEIWRAEEILPQSYLCAAGCFALGVVFSLIAFGAAYMNYFNYAGIQADTFRREVRLLRCLIDPDFVSILKKDEHKEQVEIVEGLNKIFEPRIDNYQRWGDYSRNAAWITATLACIAFLFGCVFAALAMSKITTNQDEISAEVTPYHPDSSVGILAHKGPPA